jgi:hypothetical protein
MHYTNDFGGKLKFEFSPWKCNQLHAWDFIPRIFRMILPAGGLGDGWEWAKCRAIIRQVDACFDAPFQKSEFDIDRPFAKHAHTYTSLTQTDYVGSQASGKSAISYDKIADMRVKLLAHHLKGPLMRVEVKLRHLHMSFADLLTLKNPFLKLEVYDRSLSADILLKHGLVLPKNKCIADFLRSAIRDPKKRQRIRKLLAPSRAEWWCFHNAWEGWSDLVTKLALTPQI